MAANTQSIALPLDDKTEVSAAPGERLRRSGGWLAAFLTVIMLLAVAWSVQGAEWSEGLGLLQTAVLGGAVVGLLLALTNWDSLWGAFYSLLASIPLITSLLVHGFLHNPDLHAGLLEVAQRFNTWGYHLINRQPSSDNLIFVGQLLILGWWMGHFGIWMVMRHRQPWLAALPAGIGLMFNLYYSPRNLTGYLLLFLATMLLLAIRVELARNEMRWQLAHVRYAPDIYVDFLRDGLVFAIIVVAVTWLLPAGTADQPLSDLLQPLNAQWKDVTNTWNQAFTNLRYPARGQASTFGKSLTLGGPVALTDRPIFQAESPERVYWRAATFDTYTGHQWLNTDSKSMAVDRNTTLPEPNYLLTREITVTVQTLENGQDVLFGAPGMIRTSLPVNIEYSPLSPGDTGPVGYQQGLTVSLLRSRTSVSKDSLYQVVSRVSAAPPELLRADSEPLPAGIKARYLQVPASLTSRVRDLAAQITAPYDNPYDKAVAVEAYVRSFPYNNQIAAPSATQDGVDYFLFDVKQGYCDYYASAMAMMLRVVGIPARFVVGYTPGEFASDANKWVVQEQNAHAWVEVFFPQYGWVQFEPTASQPMLSRPDPIVVAQPTPAAPSLSAGQEDPRDHVPVSGASELTPASTPASQNGLVNWALGHWLQIAAAILILTAGAVAAVLYRRRWRKLLAPDTGLVARLFDLLPGWAGRLRIPWPASHTPLEHARALGTAVPEAAPSASDLARLFVAQRYGRQEPDPAALNAAVGQWQRMQPALWRSWLRSMLPLPQRAVRFWHTMMNRRWRKT